MKSLLFLALPALAAAAPQVYGPPAPGPTASATSAAPVVVPSAPANTPGHINVNVGPGGMFAFSPNNITANVGDLVTFYFPNDVPHSVTQSSVENPCTYLAASGSSPGGFDSGLQTAVTFTINITDTNPIYFHCKQLTHCGGFGMVGTINAPASGNGSFSSFQSAAMALGSSFQADNTASGFVSGGGVDATATGAPLPDTSTGSSSGSSSGATQMTINAALLAISALVGFTIL